MRRLQRYRLHRYLAVSYFMFIAYVSLSPFSGWQEQGLRFVDVLTAPPSQTFTLFDALLNCFSYLPLGFILSYMQRNNDSFKRVLFSSTLTGFAVSLLMEYTQMYLPSRVSSNIDMFSNTLGALLGAILALSIAKSSWFARIKIWHEQWIKNNRVTDIGLAILAAWIFAQINPSLPMLGSVFVGPIARWPFDVVQAIPFNWYECGAVALNMVLLGMLMSTLLRDRHNTLKALLLVLGTVTIIKFIAATLLLKSWAVFLWLDSEAMLGIVAGLLLMLFVMRLPFKWLFVAAGLVALCYLWLMLHLFKFNFPAAVMRLYQWPYIHMMNYNGLSQFINLLFPILSVGYLWRTGIVRK